MNISANLFCFLPENSWRCIQVSPLRDSGVEMLLMSTNGAYIMASLKEPQHC